MKDYREELIFYRKNGGVQVGIYLHGYLHQF